MTSALKTLLLLLLAAAIAGCAVPPVTPPEIREGRIEQITAVELDHPHQVGVGAIVGGLAGAGLGSLIGAGTGKDVAIAVGAIAGAIGGQYAENRYEAKRPGQQIVVRLKSGVLVVVTQAANPSLYPGQQVYVQGSGADAAVVPR
jgi:outer membrane lipoprotein SlyB